jgi:cyclase
VIASGGAGTLEHFALAVTEGHADAVLAASVFHDGIYSIAEVKQAMADAGVEVRQ